MSGLPWDDPEHDVMADIREWVRLERENWPPLPFKWFYTPAEQRIIDEWNSRE